MADIVSRLETMRNMFLYSNHLNSWCTTPEFQLLYTNSDNAPFFFNLFITGCGDLCLRHFQDSDSPVLLMDSLGFAWIAAGQIEERHLTAFHILGPMFTIEANETFLRNLCVTMNLSGQLLSEVMSHLQRMPTVTTLVAVNYARMMHYCITGTESESREIQLLSAEVPTKDKDQYESTGIHGTWEAEQKMFQMIQNGNLNNIGEIVSQFSSGRVGTMCPNDPLRQAKDEMICFAVLCSRAIILGGVSPEGGYNIADYYIQRAEAATSISAVANCATEMLQVSIARVQQCKANSRYTAPISACMEYIETHIEEKISLDIMAKKIGYASYYLSSKFQKEVGLSISAYTKQRKVEAAKRLLKNTSLSAVEVSEKLSFSSPSYFGSVFRQCTGMTPNEYQNKNE